MVTRMRQTILRPAVAMIELVFALVIMGIVLMSAPMLVSTAMQSGYTSTQQELIAATSSHLSLVLSRHWDEANTLGTQNARILTTATGAALGLGDAGGGVRAGTPTVGSHRTFVDNVGATLAATPIGNAGEADAGLQAFDDIDDYNGMVVNLTAGGAAGANGAQDDYLDTNIPITTTVNYINATPTQLTYNTNNSTLNYNNPFGNVLLAVTSDIKSIQVNLVKNADTHPNSPRELDANIILNAFSCNIGSFSLDSRSL